MRCPGPIVAGPVTARIVTARIVAARRDRSSRSVHSVAVVALALSSFDMFHVGHLHALRDALRHAAQSSEDLVVGVASDELVSARLGRDPRVALPERLEVLGAFFPDADIRTVSTDGAELVAELGVGTVFACVPPDDAAAVVAATPSGCDVVALPYRTTDSASLRSTLEPEVLWPLRGGR